MLSLVLVTAVLAVSEKPVSARDIAEKYSENEVAADAAYKGQRVVLTGPVEKVWRDIPDGTPVIDLETGVDEYSSRRIVCYLRKGHHEDQVAALRRGHVVTLACTGAGQHMSIVMKDCDVVGSSRR
jgi:hypothetical protein